MKALEQKMSYTTGAVEDAKTRRQELEKKQEEMKRNLKVSRQTVHKAGAL